jgi:hypothetical protein
VVNSTSTTQGRPGSYGSTASSFCSARRALFDQLGGALGGICRAPNDPIPSFTATAVNP